MKVIRKPNRQMMVILEDKRGSYYMSHPELSKLIECLSAWHTSDFTLTPGVSTHEETIAEYPSKVVTVLLSCDNAFKIPIAKLQAYFKDRVKGTRTLSRHTFSFYGEGMIHSLIYLEPQLTLRVEALIHFEEVLEEAYTLIAAHYCECKKKMDEEDIDDPINDSELILQRALRTLDRSEFGSTWRELGMSDRFPYHIRHTELLQYIRMKCCDNLQSFIKHRYE